ncbi:hypothetical protein [Nocardia sp. NPDC057030]|uniref:hypothetical protein n=1 Tax=unclassified Nocardia TaxID=2637762 RepID=UPI00362972F5
MDDSAAARWLLQEAEDHLAQDNLGIYELLWLLRGSEFDVNDDDAKRLARQITAHLIDTGAASLVKMKWPSNEIVSTGVSDIALYDDRVFDPGQEGSYLALATKAMA